MHLTEDLVIDAKTCNAEYILKSKEKMTSPLDHVTTLHFSSLKNALASSQTILKATTVATQLVKL